MQQLDRMFGPSHFLLDSTGTDVVSGENRAALLPPSPSSKSRGFVSGKLIVTHQSSDGRYWFVAVDPRQTNRWTFFPYYLLVIGATVLLCWLAAVAIVAPIRKVTATVQRFGQGDLSTRVGVHRPDEIGALARSVDEMAERLQRLVLSERRLLQDISHELRSPLARLKFSVRLARTAEDSNAALDRVERDVNRITALASEIVDMTRMEGDVLARKTENLHVASVIQEIVKDCSIEAESRDCTIHVEGQLSSIASGDPELLRRAMENVLRNAIHHSPIQGTVLITLAETLQVASITIRDYGPGVPADSLTQIFDPFFRVQEARDSDTGGIGLGLAIAQRAIQHHHGTITARNECPGLSVQITLPTLPADTRNSAST
jgi:signal transduction histidine kinase